MSVYVFKITISCIELVCQLSAHLKLAVSAPIHSQKVSSHERFYEPSFEAESFLDDKNKIYICLSSGCILPKH